MSEIPIRVCHWFPCLETVVISLCNSSHLRLYNIT
jgi:hypothetical protein